MASSLLDIKLQPIPTRFKLWIDDHFLKHPILNKLYHEKYKAK